MEGGEGSDPQLSCREDNVAWRPFSWAPTIANQELYLLSIRSTPGACFTNYSPDTVYKEHSLFIILLLDPHKKIVKPLDSPFLEEETKSYRIK